MAGPYVNPKSAADMEKGVNTSGFDPAAFAGKIAKGFSQATQPEQPQDSDLVETVPDKSLLSYEKNASNGFHMDQMQKRAEESLQKYMLENNVDRNGNPR